MHLTDDEALLWHLDFTRTDASRQQHVAACDECAARVRETSEFVAELRRPETWKAPAKRSSWRVGLAALESLELRLQDEEEEARATIARSTPARIESWSRRNPTAGAVRALVSASFDSVERDPERGLRLAQTATATASLLEEDDYPRDVVAMTRGMAWRQRANALRMRGAFIDALEALDRGAAAFSQTRVPAPELATLDYIRATILYTQGDLAESRRLLEAAIDVFRSVEDDMRWRNAQLLLSGLCERQGDPDAAVAILHDLLLSTPIDDTAFRGRILLGLGVSLLHADASRAESCLQQAGHCFRRAGMQTEAVRAGWNLGRAASLLGEDDRALTQLTEAYETAAALGIVVDVAMIALDRAEVHLRHGDATLVAELCSDALRTFQMQGAKRFGSEAFAYLEQAARAQTISLRDLDHVRGYFGTTAHSSEAPFTPPAN